MLLIHAVALVALLVPQPAAAVPPGDPAPVVRRLAATTQLAAQEYRLGVQGGRVVAEPEVEEARLFLEEARRSADLLPEAERAPAARELEALLKLVRGTGDPDELHRRVLALGHGLAERLGVSLVELPARAPSLARGAELYRAQCASCHGAMGAGDGPAGRALDPRPSVLNDAAGLATQSPLDFYRRISLGVAGTAMPAFEATLSSDDRWAVAAYATLLRLPAPQGEVPAALTVFAATASLSDDSLAALLGVRGQAGGAARVAAVRAHQPAEGERTAAVFGRVRAILDSTAGLVRAGDGAAASARAFDAYMAFEAIEREVRARNAGLADELEAAFAALRTRTAGGATAAELASLNRQLLGQLENAERAVGDTLSPANLFAQSFFLMLREGLEAILIVGALLTFLVKTGAGHRRRDIHVGVGAALVVSVLTAVALETVFQLAPAQREALEGGTMLLATAVLFYVSYWLLSKMEVTKWTNFVRSRVHEAVSSGSALALASAAFLAVYREGFETVLFYKALFVSGGAAGTVAPVFLGMGLGVAVLAVVYVAINRFGIRLPLKPFFAVTSAFLYYMAFVFAGKGVAELQDGGVLPTTVLPSMPRLPSLGIYPTLESLLAQGVLLALALGALAWVFLVVPVQERRRRPAPAEPATPRGAEGSPALANLARMQADIAELRSEVERIREQVAARRDGAVRN